jgi:pentose-5-phosphate-3-epimerase
MPITGKTVFMVTGALNADHSFFTSKTRCSQTLATIKSIRKIEKKSLIVYVDGGLKTKGIVLALYRFLIRSKVDHVIYLFNDPEIVTLRKNFKRDNFFYEPDGFIGLSKSIMELICYERAIGFIKSNWVTNLSTVIKISGRYAFAANFDIEQIYSLLSKVDFVVMRSSETYLNNRVFFPKYTRTVAWFANIKEIESLITLSKTYLIAAIETKQILDLEHAFFRASTNFKVAEIDNLFVSGLIGNTGHFIEI